MIILTEIYNANQTKSCLQWYRQSTTLLTVVNWTACVTSRELW